LAESVTVEVLITETFENSLHFLVTLTVAEMEQLSCLSRAKKNIFLLKAVFVGSNWHICRGKLTRNCSLSSEYCKCSAVRTQNIKA